MWHWKWTDLASIFKNGIVKASTYGLKAVLTFSINLFAIFLFDEDTIIILICVEKFLSLLTLFIGVAMACQPLVNTLRGENNTKAMLILMKTALRDMILVNISITKSIIPHLMKKAQLSLSFFDKL